MIVSSVNQSHEIRGILAIDCWEQPDLNGFYETIDKKINFSDIDSLIVASFETALDLSDLSQYNTIEQYSWHEFNPEVLLPLIKETRMRRTSSWLRSKFSKNTFMLLDMKSFIYHINTCVPHIKDWLVIGGAWEACTHCRPISFYGLKGIKNKNFFIADWSIYTRFQDLTGIISRHHVEKDKLDWNDAGRLYQLL